MKALKNNIRNLHLLKETFKEKWERNAYDINNTSFSLSLSPCIVLVSK